MKLKNVVTVQQEQLLDERAISLSQRQKEIDEMKENLQKTKADCEKYQHEASEIKKKLDESKAIIEDNNHGIFFIL